VQQKFLQSEAIPWGGANH